MNVDDIKLSRVDVSYPDPAFEYHDVTVLGDRQPRYMIDIPVHMTCGYCRSRHDYIASNCRNCGAPL